MFKYFFSLFYIVAKQNVAGILGSVAHDDHHAPQVLIFGASMGELLVQALVWLTPLKKWRGYTTALQQFFSGLTQAFTTIPKEKKSTKAHFIFKYSFYQEVTTKHYHTSWEKCKVERWKGRMRNFLSLKLVAR